MSSRRETKKISAELFTLTYGSLVAQLIKDYESDDEINKQLDKMGYNIGMRLVDDFLAHTPVQSRCSTFQDAAETVAKVGFRMFLGITPMLANWNAERTECSFMLDDNPLTVFAELPTAHQGLLYSNILCGVLRGALEMVHMRVEAKFVKDVLRGDETTDLRVRLIEMLHDEPPPGDE
eukprot:m.206830 g.206830  ORF g.206830 m.206830 type:complete len:178 (-) comp22047_c0_seq2:30-563(-)